MTPDAAYLSRAGLAPARYLQHAGQWSAALALAPADAATLRADILVEQHMFQLTPPGEAIAAVQALPGSALATLLLALLKYWRQLFKLDGDPIAEDPVALFAEAAADPALAGWGAFHHAISIENLRDDGVTSAAGYQRALELAGDDPFLESYVLRHQGDQLINRHGQREAGIALLRRSLYLRAAHGARPQVAAAQYQLAGELPPGPEADDLRDIARRTARELGIPWLQN